MSKWIVEKWIKQYDVWVKIAEFKTEAQAKNYTQKMSRKQVTLAYRKIEK